MKKTLLKNLLIAFVSMVATITYSQEITNLQVNGVGSPYSALANSTVTFSADFDIQGLVDGTGADCLVTRIQYTILRTSDDNQMFKKNVNFDPGVTSGNAAASIVFGDWDDTVDYYMTVTMNTATCGWQITAALNEPLDILPNVIVPIGATVTTDVNQISLNGYLLKDGVLTTVDIVGNYIETKSSWLTLRPRATILDNTTTQKSFTLTDDLATSITDLNPLDGLKERTFTGINSIGATGLDASDIGSEVYGLIYNAKNINEPIVGIPVTIVADYVLGVEDYQKLDGVSIYPNPANELLKIACPEGSSVGVYNLLGAKLKAVDKASKNIQMEISDLASGLYIVKVESEGKFYSKKIQIK